MAAHRQLSEAAEVYLRTAHHPSVTDIPAPCHPFAAAAGVESIAAGIVRLGQRESGVVYAVPGHPGWGEATVPLIRAMAAAANVPLTIVPGLSLIEATLTKLGLDVPDNLQLAEAQQLAGPFRYHPPLEPDRPALVTHLTDAPLAGAVQRSLRHAYPAEFEVGLVQNLGAADERVWRGPLHQLDEQPFPPHSLSALYLPADSRAGFSLFQQTVAHLRAPDGCPWDQKQTHQSLRASVLEEACEVLEAIDANDMPALAEELGDLMLIILLQTQIAVDHDEFTMPEVIDQIQRKLIRRHPHVFGAVKVNGVEEVNRNWEAIKQAEKAAKGQAAAAPESAMDGVPRALPALAQALTISRKAVQAGFEWPDIEGVLDKVMEEAREIVEARTPAHLEAEIGDLLFSVVNLARWRGIDAETALRCTNARFSRRFRRVEALAAARGKLLPEISIEEMGQLWEVAKQEERAAP
jgi:tetrapyrrole methylase family protein/MazG family protein